MPTYTGISTVETREAAWLTTTGDALPSLLSVNGGPWDVIQAFWTRTPPTQQTQCYVMSLTISDERVANIRIRPVYEITLELHWPVVMTGVPLAEGEQQAFRNAIDLLVQRIRGPIGDKTHGAFLSVAEVPREPGVHVVIEHPGTTVPASKELRASVTYFAEDYEIND